MQDKSKITLTMLLAVLALDITAFAASIYWGTPLRDEGWYSIGATYFYAGKIPYLDYFFTQAPGSMVLYGLFYKLFGLSLFIGRMVASATFVAAMLLAGTYIHKKSGRRGLLLFLIVVGANLHALHFNTLVVTTAFETFLLVALFRLLEKPDSLGALIGCLGLACLMTWLRISYAVVLPVLWVYALVQVRYQTRSVVLLTVVPMALIALLFGPFLLAAGLDRFLFDTVQYHTHAFGTRADVSFPLYAKAVFLWKTIKFYYPLLTFFGIAAWLLRKRIKASPKVLVTGGIGLLLFTSQIMSTVPYPKYMTAFWIALAMLLCPPLAQKLSQHRRLALFVPIGLLLLALSSPLFYRPFKFNEKHSPLDYPEKIAKAVLQIAEGDKVFTMDSRLQFAGLGAMRGFEMDIFSVVPEADERLCQRYNLQNRQRVLAVINDPEVRFLVLRSKQEFSLDVDENDPITKAVENQFRLAVRFPNYGQYSADLYLLMRK